MADELKKEMRLKFAANLLIQEAQTELRLTQEAQRLSVKLLVKPPKPA